MGIVKSEEDTCLHFLKGIREMTKLKEYPTQRRGGSGVFTFRVADKVGNVSIGRILMIYKADIVVISSREKLSDRISNIFYTEQADIGVKV
jgi:DNA gyrase/topoisomerase IV subunit A